MNPVLEQLGRIRIIPVVVINDEMHAEPLAQALLDGGLSTMEITFRTAAAKAVLARITNSRPEMLTGAGTVLSIEQAATAIDCGARYVVSPGLNPKVAKYCRQRGIPPIPGVVTPTDIEEALDLGLEVVKFFPAEASGGVAYLKAISAPFAQMKFIPTGGIDETNLVTYLRLPCVMACGGSWMVKPDLIADRKFEEIRNLAARAVEMVRDAFRGQESR